MTQRALDLESKGPGVNPRAPTYKKDHPSLMPTTHQTSLVRALTYFIPMQVQEMSILLMKKQAQEG